MTFKERLANLGFATYDDYLQSPHWLEFRALFKARKCEGCGARWQNLHHVTYERLGAELELDVLPLCRPCHEHVHAVCKENGWGINLRNTNRALGKTKQPLEPSTPKQRKQRRKHRLCITCGRNPCKPRKDHCGACRKKLAIAAPRCPCGNVAGFGKTTCRRCRGESRANKPRQRQAPRPKILPNPQHYVHPASLYAIQRARLKKAIGITEMRRFPGGKCQGCGQSPRRGQDYCRKCEPLCENNLTASPKEATASAAERDRRVTPGSLNPARV